MTKQELKVILQQDIARYGDERPNAKDWFVNNESWFISRLVKHVRHQEYHGCKGGWHKLAYLYHWYLYKRLSLRLHITIYPGTIGGGLRIYHAGDFIHVVVLDAIVPLFLGSFSAIGTRWGKIK